MSTEIFTKLVEVASWQQERARIASLSNKTEREDAFLDMLFSDDSRPVRIYYQGDAIMRLSSYNTIRNSIPPEIREKADAFLDSFPPRITVPETLLPFGKTYEVFDEIFEGWLLAEDDIQQLKQLGDYIADYFKERVDGFKNPKSIGQSIDKTFFPSKEQTYRDAWSIVGIWVAVLEKAINEKVGILVYTA